MASRCWRRRKPSQSPPAPPVRPGLAPDLGSLLSLEGSLPDPHQRLSQVVHISVSIDVEILISSLQVPQDLGLSQDSSVWWGALEPGPGADVRCEVRGAERIPHSLPGGPGYHQDLPQED